MKKIINVARTIILRAARVIKPELEIGGLDISDSRISFISINPETDAVTQASCKLPTGAVQDGVIKDSGAFQKALKELHARITYSENKKIPVIVSISDTNVFTQAFTLPQFQGSALKDAVELNMRAASPIEYEHTYHDWEQIQKRNDQDSTGETELLSSFIKKDIIDVLCQNLKNTSFIPVAIEQRAVSFARCINELVDDVTFDIPYCILHIGGDGASFAIIKWGRVYFANNVSWDAVVHTAHAREISFAEFTSSIVQGVQRIVNYYTSRFPDDLSALFFVAPGLEQNIIPILSSHIHLPIKPVALKKYIVEGDSIIALGGALRGLVSRSKDAQISLTPEGTEAEFFHSQVTTFITMWRAIAVVVCGVILVAAFSSFLFLRTVVYKNAQGLSVLSVGHTAQELGAKKREAEVFNAHIDRALRAKAQQTRWAEVVDALYKKAGTEIVIERLYAQSPGLPVLVNARAINEQAMITFKNELSQIARLKNIDLPVTSVIRADNGEMTFRLSFTLDK
ncbi:MAG: pilus assembly protein PilM [Candidatus Pacebacteria bacterium]|nr:pilus assembly protein PilM [Candidatus Paceibacterota bacterium]